MTDVRLATHPTEFDALPSAALRERFLVEDLFAPGELRFCLSQGDRVLIGGAMPGDQPLELVAPDEVRAEALCDRRELGIVCLSGQGTVTADGTGYAMEAEDILYVGAGTGTVTVAGDAAYYLVSVPAHRQLPTTLIPRDEADVVEVGDDAAASKRTIRKYVHGDRVASCELAIGITTLAPGSVWNTMPCHTHDRRTETYLYFDLPENERVVHLCGQPSSTRSIIVADRQAVISPPWSVHFGAGTASYKFVWATGGENLAYNDMDPVDTASLA
ncbi:4-deoxy-L-threo-5-hexosulose-uronate ketol-isomerase [Phycicoccus badiiscoriae]|uniref:5-dehydro-4-deoxy-D-glucuronate isomerase n=1 Tax=Pedococcus badiiscoriae TaxID=642776 RepID=A0A852WID5_9MICO|nr:5-dehydro-4-deoxy-D-glucuronate isomerase [Pedococcus badiiscoriae]NYG08650.1 4-deoxy-L-threo-5-hexosulose-uronate ketol-isomerase [Pedococcus badiiscoriae]